MKKQLISVLLLLLFILIGCNAGSDVKVELNKGLYYKDGAPSVFEIKVTENGKPLENLDISAEFAMLSMDHGTVEKTLDELGDGVYSSTVQLTMPGEWEIVFSIEQNGESFEKVLTYHVEESEIVASINGEVITTEDLEFYQFINELHIEIGRELDKSKLTGEALDNAIAYWEEQERSVDNRNLLLTQIIRLRAMALLGEEKGHTVSEEEIASEIEKVRKEYEQFDIAKSMIQNYGEEKFWNMEEKQYERIILSQKVQQDLINDVKKEHPDVNEQEIMYLASKKYDELLVSQVNSLEVEIF